MRIALYLLAAIVHLTAALGMALLPRLTTHPLLFGLVGATLSGALAGAWLLGRAVAGDLPRPQTGKALLAFAAPAALVNLWQGHYLAAAWSLLVLLAGLGFAVRIFPVDRRTRRSLARGPVRSPVSR